ncbi:MBL fold metallo-hydrolase [Microbulbifer variabilis]|uniref:MBL fold metallo-hydrolase n=1 Tax=Microbulbifer variabilis TaxID=266805 RepID=UPI0003740CF0|nr:MBL fold metallo-hydrolase [Microbulbifer variabilis]
MSSDLIYLKEEAYFEPLVNHWFAWSYLIPPVQAARYMAITHKRIMSSFVENARVHIMAAQVPALTGGEFLNARADQVEDIKSLLLELENQLTDVLELSEAVEELDKLIRAHSDGKSIEYLYKKTPEPLRGFIEIVQDINHNPGYRLIEPLLYHSKHYRKSLQSVYFGLLSRVGERPFCFSTPRLADENHMQWMVDFCTPEVDLIVKSRTEGIVREVAEAIFSRTEVRGGLHYNELFTSQPPTRRHKPISDGGVKLTFLGHASFMLETRSINILIDPVIPVRGEHYADDVISYSELPETINYICITHNHHDHFNLETLLQLRHKADKLILPVNNGGTIIDPSMKLIAQQLGFKVIEVGDIEEVEVPDGKIEAIPFLGEHGDLNIRSKTVWYIELMGKKFLFGADATNSDPVMYRHVHKLVGDVDVLAIGMECVGAPYTWIYGALNTKPVSKDISHSRRLNGSNAEQAYHMVETFNARQVFLYAMGLEPWYKYFMGLDYKDNSEQIIESDKMIKLCSDKGVACQRLVGKNVTFY